MKFRVLLIVLIVALSGCSDSNTEQQNGPPSAQAEGEKSDEKTAAVEEISWDDLIPEDSNPEAILDEYQAKYNIAELADDDPIMAEFKERILESNANAPVVESFQGKMVKIPGYVLPLNIKHGTATEFLLVPYFGACIHVPPPPANQTVYVKTPEKPLKLNGLYDAVWVTGTVQIEKNQSEYAESGYTIEAKLIEPYE